MRGSTNFRIISWLGPSPPNPVSGALRGIAKGATHASPLQFCCPRTRANGNRKTDSRESDWLLGGAGQEDTLHIGSDLGGLLFTFFVGEAGQGMLGHNELVVRHSHHAGHGFGGWQENVGDNGDCGNPQPLHLDAVVHTARTARPSIPDPGNQHVHLVQKLLDCLRLGGQGGRGVLAQ